MAQVTKGNAAPDNDLLDFEETQPVGRQSNGREAETFTPNAAILEKMAPMLARSGAVNVKGTFSTCKDAVKAARNLHKHALVLAEQMDPPKSAAIRLVDSAAVVVKPVKDNPNPGVGPYRAIVEITHKRTAKTKDEAAK